MCTNTNITHKEIMDYLCSGGLMEILKHDLAKDVWICKDHRGVSHTFTKPDNGVGGLFVPPLLTQDEQIFSGKVPDVIEFLQGFDLSESKANEVVRIVGTAP